MRRRAWVIWVAGVACFRVGVADAQVPFFQGLGDLPGGTFSSSAQAVSADGRVVVGDGTSAAGTEAFRWTRDGGMVGLGDFAGGMHHSAALSVSGDGSVVVGYGAVEGPDLLPFRWTAATGLEVIGRLDEDPSAQARAVSLNGQVIVGVGSSSNGVEAFRWTRQTRMVPLGDLPGGTFSSNASGVNADGSVVVGGSDGAIPDGGEAFSWTAATGMVSLGDLPGGSTNSGARNVSADGTAIVGEGNSANGSEAFLWRLGQGMIGLGDLPGGPFGSVATSVSADGSVVVGSGQTALGIEAFVWDSAHGMRRIQDVLSGEYGFNLTGWRLTQAAVSADGLTFAGAGFDPLGRIQAWVATVPEPGVLLPAALATQLLLRRKLARRRQPVHP